MDREDIIIVSQSKSFYLLTDSLTWVKEKRKTAFKSI